MPVQPHIVGIGGTLRAESRSLLALKYALAAARQAGATVELIDLRKVDLPMFNPDLPLENYGENVQHFIHAAHRAHGMLWSTGAYHGTLAGVTKNAIDFLDFLSDGDHPYLREKVVGLIATASGDMAGPNTLSAMVHSVHALRGVVAPLMVTIPQAGKAINPDGSITNPKSAQRLTMLGELVVELALKLHPETAAEPVSRT